MPLFARRFRRNALLLAVASCAALILVFVTALVLATGPDPTAPIVAWVIGAGLLIGGAVFALNSLRRSTAMRRVIAANPRGKVFLARRQPSVISDLAAYVPVDVYDEVSDSWVVASIDARGIAAWSIGRDSRELLLVPWAEIGAVEGTRLENGRAGIAVDVKPFPTPLIVSVGYSAYGIMAGFGGRGVREVVDAANALRPPLP